MESTDLDVIREAVGRDDIDTLVAQDPDQLYETWRNPEALGDVSEVEGGIQYVRHLLYTAWWWAAINQELGKTGVPDVVRENLRWKFDWSQVECDPSGCII